MGRRVSLREQRRGRPGDGGRPRDRGRRDGEPARPDPPRLGRPVHPPGGARTCSAHLARPGEVPLPPWFPAPVAEARQIVLLVLDGLGVEQLRERSGLAPVLQSATGSAITSVAPSTTACALTTLGDRTDAGGARRGRLPGGAGRRVMNVLQWTDPRCRRPYAGAGAGVPAVRVLPRFDRPGARGHPLRLRAHRVHRRPSRARGAAPLAHAGRARDRRGSAGGRRRAVRLRLLRRHRQDRPRPRSRALLRRRATRHGPPRRRRARRVAGRGGARRDRGPRPGRRGGIHRGARPRDHGAV